MATKMTKRDYFNTLRELSEVQANPALIGFIDHEIELLDRKNSGEHKPTKTQVANEALKEALIQGMIPGQRYQVKDLVKSIDVLSELTVQKVSSLVRQLKEANRINREEVKGVAYFYITD